MLDYYGVNDVKIVQGQGMLIDYYNLVIKMVSFSFEVYYGCYVVVVVVVVYECGYVIQYDIVYVWLQMCLVMVLVVSFVVCLQQYFLFFVLGIFGVIGGIFLVYFIIVVFGIIMFFSMVILLVEFDVSNWVLVWLELSNFIWG